MDFYILNLGTFLIAIIILTLTPGLDTALIIRNTSRSGWLTGVMTSFGICCGLFGHAILSSIGISAVLMKSTQLFDIMKLLGAGYLIYLGLSSLSSLSKPSKSLDVFDASTNSCYGLWRGFREGILSNILNPKTAVFYLAFLPQFINSENSPIFQSLFMASIHFVIAMIWQCGLVSMINFAKSFVNNSSTIKWMEVSTGTVLVVLGVKLALGN